MTAARQKRKRYCLSFAAIAGLSAYAGLTFVLAAGLGASAGERIVVDWHTGLAIDGYDPVAFFTDGKPVQGSADLELRKGSVIWRFTNVGNRAAFAARAKCLHAAIWRLRPCWRGARARGRGQSQCVDDPRSASVSVL